MDSLQLLARTARQDCTKDTCPASESIYGYAPNFNFTVAYIAGFAISAIIFSHQAVAWKKWRFFSIVCAIGCLMESCGYIGRLMLHHDPFDKLGFKLNVILLTVAPAFLSAGIYLTLKRAVIVFGTEYSRLSPAAYAYIFISSDVVSILLQGIGGSISAVAQEKKLLDQGVDIMIAGLASQVFTLLIFFVLCVEYAYRCWRNKDRLSRTQWRLACSHRFQFFVGATMLAFLCIFARCCYRVAELSDGWGSKIMRREAEFIILDSDMCTLAAVAMNIFHPGYFFVEPAEVIVDETGEKKKRQETGTWEKRVHFDSICSTPVAPAAPVCPRCQQKWEEDRNWI